MDGITIRNFTKVPADVVLIDDTLISVGLVSNIAKNQAQNFRAWIPFTLGATGGFQLQVIVPAAGVKYAVTINFYDTVGGVLLYDAQTSSAPFGDVLTGAGTYWAEVTGYVRNGVNAGIIDIQVAQNTTDVLTATVLEGASIDVCKS